MSPSLLDCSDEILISIGNFAHGDADIAIPSFNPHWANFKHEIDPSVHQDYLAYRAVCQRIRSLLPLRDLHIVIRKWSQVLRWTLHNPVGVSKAVKRMMLDVPKKSHAAYAQATPDDNVEGSKEEEQILANWIVFSRFLAQFDNLQELIITSNPLCRTPHPWYEDAAFHLPAVTSFAVESRCLCCCQELVELLVPAAPNIKHLKALLEDCLDLETIRSEWCARNPTADQILPLHTLMAKCIRTAPQEDLRYITETCPEIEALHLFSFPGNRSDPPHRMDPFLDFTTTEREDWLTTWETPGSTHPGMRSERMNADSDDYWEDEAYLFQELAPLKLSKNLQVLDLGVGICYSSLISKANHDITISPVTTATQYQRTLRESRLKPRQTDVAKAAVQRAALGILSNAPSLKRGHFWEYQSPVRHASKRSMKRWTWRLTDKHDVVVEDAEEFPFKWTHNRDGEFHNHGTDER
ncbi:uncharacterized protein I303_107133 [Kwoniella dejecticola CBS 10117]|uniref:Uncharacterized protein n=1 Tax=Kwoniella dejecticola CBS 10117 TaxID=1296121 RepID=A0A1A5ZYU2_9TREE|nr:uncharacterized protein I303_06535 [Kwoniella dejecticola CBS 10117]OBR82977.1 hypothetical protein I303_06535 [Kwoniella dejecticola CBS 10117]